MNKWLKRWLALFAPGIVDGDGGVADRGDDFIPTDDDAPGGEKTPLVVTDEDKKAVGVEGAQGAQDAKDGTPTAEEAAAAKAKDDEAKAKEAKKDTRISLARHEQILEKAREREAALQTELANLKQGQKAAATSEDITKSETKLAELEAKHAQLVTDGDAAKAAATMGEIRKLERSIIQAQSAFEIQAAEARAYERVKYDSTVERLEAAYPRLNEDHTDFDKELMGEVVELFQGFMATGRYSRSEAIQKAAKTLAEPLTTRQKAAVETEVRVDAEDVAAAAKKDAAKAVADARTAAARAKAAEAVAATPPSLSKVGLDSSTMGGKLDGKAVMKMSQDQFAKLDETTLARLRGDELV